MNWWMRRQMSLRMSWPDEEVEELADEEAAELVDEEVDKEGMLIKRLIVQM